MHAHTHGTVVGKHRVRLFAVQLLGPAGLCSGRPLWWEHVDCCCVQTVPRSPVLVFSKVGRRQTSGTVEVIHVAVYAFFAMALE